MYNNQLLFIQKRKKENISFRIVENTKIIYRYYKEYNIVSKTVSGIDTKRLDRELKIYYTNGLIKKKMYITIYVLILFGVTLYLKDKHRKEKFDSIKYQEYVYSYDRHKNEITFYFVCAYINNHIILSKIDIEKNTQEKITIRKKDVDKYYTMNTIASGLDRAKLISKYNLMKLR